ncbi:MAG: prephenate dehydrogenase/arogenate dehydrogenase family protein [Candidatus Aminicenantales bacterium]
MSEKSSIRPSTKIKRVVVVGVGKMGSWLAAELAKSSEVAVFDLDLDKAQAVAGTKVLRAIEEIESFSPDLLLNAVNLQNTVAAFEAAKPFLRDECLLADITSVKGELPKYYQECGRGFVSVHPMFGPTFADLSQISAENVIIIKESARDGKDFFRDFFGRFGMRIFEYSFEEHDQIIAYSLTVPFASTLVFAAHLHTLSVPGTTFRKHLEIARGLLSEDDYLMAEILFNPHSLPQLEKITQRLEFLKHIIRSRDYEEMRRFFDRLRANLKIGVDVL